jgi:hypothetical protein
LLIAKIKASGAGSSHLSSNPQSSIFNQQFQQHRPAAWQRAKRNRPITVLPLQKSHATTESETPASAGVSSWGVYFKPVSRKAHGNAEQVR